MAATDADQPRTPSVPGGDAVLSVQRICLDFQSRAEMYRPRFLDFLQKHRTELGLTDVEDLAGAYLHSVWPPDLPSNLIIANASFDRFGRWIIRPPVDGPAAPTYAAGGLVPAFAAYRKKGRMVIDGFYMVAHVPPRSFEARVSAEVQIDPVVDYMTSADLAALSALPNPRKAAAERLALWSEFLDWSQKLVQLNRVAFRYDAVQPAGEGFLRFFICGSHTAEDLHRRLGTMFLAAPRSASQTPDRWDPHPDQRPPFVPVGKLVRFDATALRKKNHANRTRTGTRSGSTVVLTVRTEDAHELIRDRELAEQGFVVSAVGGDLKPLNNEQRAIERLRKGQGHNPYLADWLFDITNAAEPASVPDVFAAGELVERLNDEQRGAVNKNLAASDLCLDQGPPGTGKTTVIGVIADRTVASGGRVLLASQTNLAVDNMLKQRAAHPEIRPLRVGNAERIEPDCRHFLLENVVGHWFAVIGQDCTRRMRAHTDALQLQRGAEQALSRLHQVLRRADELQAESTACEQQLRELRPQHEVEQVAESRTVQQAAQLQRTRQTLNDLIVWLESPDAEPPSVELLAETPAAKLLSQAAQKLRRDSSQSDWELPWLPPRGNVSPQAALDALHIARAVLPTLMVLESQASEALTLCKGARSTARSAEAARLRKLQAEREHLLASEREKDLTRVARINREVKQLRGERWSATCRSLRETLQEIFRGPLPGDLDDLTASLGPARKWVKTLQALQSSGTLFRKGVQSVWNRTARRIETQVATTVRQLGTKVKAARTRADKRRRAGAELEHEIATVEDRLEQATAGLREARQRWEEVWPEVCIDPNAPQTAPRIAPAELQAREEQLRHWLDQQAPARKRASRLRPILDEWVQRLQDPASADREALRDQYVRHANVIGVTCNEAGQRDFYDRPDFEPFDIVIIDEVSKATPPELLMPMLLGRKVILVGDHRQLPPMYREHEASYAEAVAERLIEAEDFHRFRKLVTASFFAELFDAASDTLRQTLVMQYRMQSQVMGADNPFYGGQLVAGPDAKTLDQLRQHHLHIRDVRGGWFLEPHQHVLWVDSTRDHHGRFAREEQHGTSKANTLEVELVTQTLLRLSTALCKRGYGPLRQVVADRAQDGVSVRSCVEQLMPGAAPEAISDWVAKKRIMLNGRAARGDELVHAGDLLDVDARKAVAVITFYGAQIRAIRQRLEKIQVEDPDAMAALDLRSNTVDRFQGMERAIVLVSLVRALPTLRGGDYVRQFQRINVALSRAQELLVIIGAERTFRDALVELPSTDGGPAKQIPVYRRIHELVKSYGGRRYANQLIH